MTATLERRCGCCDLPTYSCGLAAERRLRLEREAERRRLLSLPGIHPAKRPGRCSDCGDQFQPGFAVMRDPQAASGGPRLRCVECCPIPGDD
jgi:hypothetical protein